ncbi:tyrosine-type recombinase/integrase [Novilysobacter erysipheiresistens]|uniref:tyrosine-type recombinase/integrase n=1 Tax=Novilysobacter erysipheiresistens TaxID=1749332 RepID=UPI003CE5A4ED
MAGPLHYPHLLRTAVATELHRNGCNLMALAYVLGHASVETTPYYLAPTSGSCGRRRRSIHGQSESRAQLQREARRNPGEGAGARFRHMSSESSTRMIVGSRVDHSLHNGH